MPRNDLPEIYGIRKRPTDWNRIAQYPGIIRRVIEWNGESLTIDPFFVEDVHRLRSFNLRYLIFFHRIRADRPIIPQADAFLRALDLVGGLRPHEIVELDIEPTPEKPVGMWPTAHQCRQWFDYVEPRIGRGTGIYMGTNAPVDLRSDPVVASKPWRRPAWTGTTVPGLWWAQQWECRIPAEGFSGNVCQNEIQNYDILNRLARYTGGSILEGQVITREECGMPPPARQCGRFKPHLVKGMIIHYTGSVPKNIRNLEEFKRAANGVYSLYTRPISQGGRGMCDHGYNADASQGGDFVWTRGLETMSGAQGSPGNSWYVAIHCQIGGNQEPSEALLNRLCWAAGKVQEKYPGATAVLGHKQSPNMSTSCPGDPMMRHILAGRIRPDFIHQPPPPPPPPPTDKLIPTVFIGDDMPQVTPIMFHSNAGQIGVLADGRQYRIAGDGTVFLGDGRRITYRWVTPGTAGHDAWASQMMGGAGELPGDHVGELPAMGVLVGRIPDGAVIL